MIFRTWIWLSSGLSASAILLIFGFLCLESYTFLTSSNAAQVFSGSLWFPKEGIFGALALVAGTLGVALGGLLIAVPLAWLSAFAIVFYLNRRISNFVLAQFEIFASVPPVIVGLFGLLYLIPVLGSWSPPGFGLLAASIVLSLLLIPHLTVAACEILRFELDELTLISKSLGLNLQTFIKRIIWPDRRGSLWRSAGLMSGRALGETLAIMMVAGNAIRIPNDLFDSVRTINSTLALEMPYARELHRSALFTLGLITFALILVLQRLFRRDFE